MSVRRAALAASVALGVTVLPPAPPAEAIDPTLTLTACDSGDPIPMPLAGAVVRRNGTMHGRIDGFASFGSYCTGFYPEEAHYCLRVGQPGTAVDLELVDGGGVDTTLALVPADAADDPNVHPFCDDDGGNGLLSRLQVTLDAGVYAIYVGTFGSDVSSTFALEVRRP